ncbi:amino acid adenylation domain-containing protein [Planosporangium flavigriseum]|uniref:amino acid adenylation domain-containing protein n=1 Tax=Planosporangium flavigriseum TaxID=373681 RepID=UPI00143C4863|nr:amino acid adenylation domain-containing protein [Planosporangium flavigriseum]NJC67404.1 amino acid adenylation domain-containing protein [Planosporangium flavigriseum]
MFAGFAHSMPGAVAVEDDQDCLTYAELDQRATALARAIVDRGCQGGFVGVLLGRSMRTIVALLAVLKAGAAYVPLEPAYPQARLREMIEQCGTTLVLTTAAAHDHIGGLGVDVILLDEERHVAATDPFTEPERRPLDPAYVMFTSGTTGRPKAVVVSHHNVVNLATGADYVDLSPARTVLQFAPISFDASTFEIWGALLNGAKLVVAPEDLLGSDRIGEMLARHKVDTMWLTSALFHRIVDTDLPALEPVTQLLAGGDVLSADHVRRALAAVPGRAVVNGYGPTETTTFACCHRVSAVEDACHPMPIGRAIPGVRLWIMTEEGVPAAPGEAGELWIAGDGVSLGYLGDPDESSRKFVPEPGRPDSRAYRSGDLVLLRGDGLLEFLGRIDDQVKVRGYRIEPAEVEAALVEQSTIRRAVVTAQEFRPGDKRLVAYLVLSPGAELRVPQLRRALSARLPSYLVPARYVVLDDLPVTRNGKVDRRALPVPEWTAPAPREPDGHHDRQHGEVDR